MKELRMFCAEDEQGRTCWMTAFRLFKVLFLLKSNAAGFRASFLFNSICEQCCLTTLSTCVFQYGIVLYQNYKIPQQRKTLLSHFSAPVVSLTSSQVSDD